MTLRRTRSRLPAPKAPTTTRTVTRSAVAILATAALALAGCSVGGGGSSEESTGDVTLTMTVWGGQLDEKVYKDRLAMAKKEFPNITVNLQLTSAAGDYQQKVQTMIAGNKGPDIMEVAETLPVFADKNQLQPLDEYLDKNNVDLVKRYGDKAPKIYEWEGKQYAVPDRSGAMVLFYNKDMFDKAGVKYPSQDWTWQDFLAAAQKLTIRQGNAVTQWGYAGSEWWAWWLSMFYQNGGRVLDDAGKPVVNSPENVEALQFWHDLVWKHKVAPTPRDFANFGQGVGPDQLFAQGKLAMEMTGFWNIGALKSVPNINWDIAPIYRGKQAATTAFFNGLAISRSSKHPADAFKVINYITGAQAQKLIVDNAEDAPASLELLSHKDFLDPPWLERDVNMKAFGDSSDAIFVPPLTPQWNEMVKVFTDQLGKLFRNESNPQATLDEIQKQLESTVFR